MTIFNGYGYAELFAGSGFLGIAFSLKRIIFLERLIDNNVFLIFTKPAKGFDPFSILCDTFSDCSINKPAYIFLLSFIRLRQLVTVIGHVTNCLIPLNQGIF